MGIEKNTFKRILIEDLHLKKLCFLWVPHILTEDQKNKRLEGPKQLLSMLQSFSKSQLKMSLGFLWYNFDGLWTYGGVRLQKQNIK